jgi:hypothetical protein
VFPFLVGEGRFFSGAIQWGGLMQIANAFGKVQDSLSWFINVYSGAGPNTGFVGWKATVDRLTGFHNAVLLAQEQQRNQPGTTVVTGESSALELKDLSLDLPNGQPLIQCSDISMAQNASVLIRVHRARARARCSVRSPGSGRSAKARSSSPPTSTRYSCRSVRTFRSVRCARQSVIHCATRRS